MKIQKPKIGLKKTEIKYKYGRPGNVEWGCNVVPVVVVVDVVVVVVVVAVVVVVVERVMPISDRAGRLVVSVVVDVFPVVVVPFVVVVVVGRLMPISDRAGRLAQLWLLLVLQPTTIDLSPHMSETQSSIFFHIPRANHCNALEPLKSFEPFQLLKPLEPLKPFEPLQPPN